MQIKAVHAVGMAEQSQVDGVRKLASFPTAEETTYNDCMPYHAPGGRGIWHVIFEVRALIYVGTFDGAFAGSGTKCYGCRCCRYGVCLCQPVCNGVERMASSVGTCKKRSIVCF
jgi:hypothetical protein